MLTSSIKTGLSFCGKQRREEHPIVFHFVTIWGKGTGKGEKKKEKEKREDNWNNN